MAAATTGARLKKRYDASAAATQLTVSTEVGQRRKRLIAVHVKYSAAETKNVTVTLDSGLGAAYDALIATIALSSAASGSFIPEEPFIIAPDDIITVVAPAGETGVTVAITIVYEELP